MSYDLRGPYHYSLAVPCRRRRRRRRLRYAAPGFPPPGDAPCVMVQQGRIKTDSVKRLASDTLPASPRGKNSEIKEDRDTERKKKRIKTEQAQSVIAGRIFFFVNLEYIFQTRH
ncbi:hypothetical protein E2C01_077764 [Portunus trituberculatus]|uniref:Uncharacterized protein n=1 Tax=Portunus trituberculatus TaxID=210409 RepID=A0A5B7ISC0_PORTR|nr:hypothetical protein [Portunus trituberculatus]